MFLIILFNLYFIYRSNFINILHHQSDFGIACTWHFFATSHGKSPCDGIGGTVKRLTARASLQHPWDKPITTAKAMYNFAESNIKGIKYVLQLHIFGSIPNN
jgi:hypothetical protein